MDKLDHVNHVELTVHPSQIRSTLRALLLAVFFHRSLDNVDPETLEFGDVHVVSGGLAVLSALGSVFGSGRGLYTCGILLERVRNREIEQNVDRFSQEYLDAGQTTGEIAVILLQRKAKRGWFAVTEDLVPWEEHLITLHFPPVPYGSPPPPNALPSALFQILTYCAEKKGDVPPLAASDGTPLLTHNIMVAPPGPEQIFSPSPTLNPRLTSPPPAATTTTTPAVARAKEFALSGSSAPSEKSQSGDRSRSSSRRDTSPAVALGYLEQAKDGLRAVGARAGAVTGWKGRGGLGRP